MYIALCKLPISYKFATYLVEAVIENNFFRKLETQGYQLIQDDFRVLGQNPKNGLLDVSD